MATKMLGVRALAALAAGLLAAGPAISQPPPKGKGKAKGAQKGAEAGTPAASGLEPQIQWYATLDRGLAEVKRTGKPILFVSAAPHCAGVSGRW